MARHLTVLKAMAVTAVLAAAHPGLADDPGTCRLAILGDSLTSAYGLPVSEGFPAALDRALEAQGIECEILDAGVSGDTTAGGLSRVDWVLSDQPTHLMVELGGNDGLRGLPVEQMRANLSAIIERAQAEGVDVLLTGMKAPPNFGESYTESFAAVFPELAETYDVPLYPFFLEGVAAERAYNQPDGIHPNAEGVEKIVAGILPTVLDWLEDTGV